MDLVRHLDSESATYAQARSEGNFDIAAVTAGESVGLIHEVPSVQDLIPAMVRGAAALLKTGPTQLEWLDD